MRIILPCHFPLEGSGSGIYVRHVTRELIARGHEVSILAPAHAAHAGMSLPVHELVFSADDPLADAPFDFPSFTTHPLSHKTFEEMNAEEVGAYVDTYRTHVDEATRQFKPDLIHAQHLWVAAKCAVDTGVPVVTTSHGTDVMGFKSCPAFRDQASAAARGSRAIIAVSHDVARDVVILLGPEPEKLHVIHNGVETALFHPRTVDVAHTLAALGAARLGARVLAFVGKLTWFKGADLLIQAAEVYEHEAPDLMTLIVGGGALQEDLESLANGLGLERVAFVGSLSHDRIPDVFNAADLTCVPSRREPFSLAALESMACGTPVVGFRSGGLPEFVTPERGALVPEVSPHALARAVLAELAANAKAAKGPAAAEFVRRERSWSHVVDEVLGVYERALA